MKELQKYGVETPYFTLRGISTYARVVSVYDGDTMTCVIPVLGHYFKFHTRMMGIDTCEIRSKRDANKQLALRAKGLVLELITSGGISRDNTLSKAEIETFLQVNPCIVWIECLDFDKYGRVLINVKVTQDSTETVSDILIKEHLAYQYGGDTKLTEEEQIHRLAETI